MRSVEIHEYDAYQMHRELTDVVRELATTEASIAAVQFGGPVDGPHAPAVVLGRTRAELEVIARHVQSALRTLEAQLPRTPEWAESHAADSTIATEG